MGVKDMGNDGDEFVSFREGDNAIVEISQLEVDTGSYQGDEYKQLAMEFDAVNESDKDQSGIIPGWFTSKITIAETDEHKSALGKLLSKAGVLEEVVSDVVDDSSVVEAIIDGEKRFVAETDDENESLGMAVASALDGKKLRVGTSLNSSGDYSVVKSVHGLAEDEGNDNDSDEEVLFDEESEEEDE